MTDVLEPAPSEGVGSAWHPALKDFVAGDRPSLENDSHQRAAGSASISAGVSAAPLTVRAESAGHGGGYTIFSQQFVGTFVFHSQSIPQNALRVAGGIGGAAGVVAGQPLDTVRIRLQQACAPADASVLTLLPDPCRERVRLPAQPRAVQSFAGMLCGKACQLGTSTPSAESTGEFSNKGDQVARSALQPGHGFSGVLACWRHTLAREGPQALFRGVTYPLATVSLQVRTVLTRAVSEPVGRCSCSDHLIHRDPRKPLAQRLRA